MAIDLTEESNLEDEILNQQETAPENGDDLKFSEPEISGEQPFVPVPFDPPSVEETFRRSGLAWSTGIVFFGSIVFMMGLGWLADWVFGSSPWGLVGGIIIGSIIGFVQFFRISSQIFRPNEPREETHPLFSNRDDDDR